MTDRDRWDLLVHFACVAASVPEPPPALEKNLAAHERRVLEDSLEQTRRTLAALKRRGEHRAAAMARRSVMRLERELLDLRARAAGIPVPAADHRPRGRRERAAISFP